MKVLGAVAIVLAMLAVSGAAFAQARWDVTGDGAQLEPRLRQTSQLHSALREKETQPRAILSAALADYAGLLDVLFAEGYLAAEIRIILDGREAAEIPLLSVPGSFANAEVRVRTGPRFTFGRLAVGPVASGTEFPEGLRQGAPARLGTVVDALDAAVAGWRDLGYPMARVASQQIAANHATQTLNIDARIDAGPQARFGRLIVADDSAVETDRIIKIAGLPSGRLFSPEGLRAATARLRASGAFSSVVLREAEDINPDGTIDVIAEITDAKPRRLGFGAELSTADGVALSGFWLHRNAFSGAERLRVDGRIENIGASHSASDYELGVQVEVPAIIGPDTAAIYSITAAHEDEPDYVSDSLTVSAGLRRKYSDTLEGSLTIRFERAETEDALGSRDFSMISIPITATRDRRDDPLNAMDGDFLKATLMPFQGLGGEASGVKGELDARRYWQLGTQSPVVVAGRVQIGAIAGPALTEVRPDYLFHSGGGNSVRGQEFQSLGVEIAPDDSIGGRSFVATSLEARIPVTDTIGAVGFFDSGYVGSETFFDGTGEWHHGAGVGARYNTPVGPIRLDVAVPVGNKRSGNFFVYIGIGQAF